MRGLRPIAPLKKRCAHVLRRGAHQERMQIRKYDDDAKPVTQTGPIDQRNFLWLALRISASFFASDLAPSRLLAFASSLTTSICAISESSPAW